jgi:hypothetical protein
MSERYLEEAERLEDATTEIVANLYDELRADGASSEQIRAVTDATEYIMRTEANEPAARRKLAEVLDPAGVDEVIFAIKQYRRNMLGAVFH